ncbi:tfIIB-brf [Baffinella frigidus]|nr:tfIIB-brf [Cryptophyta sp. CCMP2293]|mmetsp:Transcript_22647/g.54300  ORF Transcript_22647/g.54300 Transcript_22647/m.54300 type:complete len:405 (-) Transcript_22647:70-1284(-)
MKCTKCGNREVEFDFSIGTIICNFCGFLIEENIANSDLNFDIKNFSQSRIKGQIIKNLSFGKKTRNNDLTNILNSGIRRKINQLGNSLKLQTYHNESAFKLFVFAIQKGIINNRKLHIMCISCLYTICRKEKTPHLLIDFSDITQTRSNKIGIEFLKFTRMLNFSLPTIDPSLFIHRFAIKMNLGFKKNAIAMSALRIVARMKRDWISTGRRPTGLCGAALLLASKMHGIKRSQKEISSLVRIGNVSLRNRLREIDKTSISMLTRKNLDFGGGDDGNNDTLVDFQFSNQCRPPSKKNFLRDFPNSVYLIKKNNSLDCRKITRKMDGTEKSIKNYGQFYLKNFVTKKKPLKCLIKKEKVQVYLNNDFELIVKDHIWAEINSNYFFSQSIMPRSQKERPFYFSKII